MKRQLGMGLVMTTMGAIISLGALSLATGTANATPQARITICHSTSSESNPFVEITVNASSIDELNNKLFNGHGDDANDIIPAFGTFPGRNWDADGKAMLANDCNPKDITVTEKVTICHATGSATNEYEQITVSASSIDALKNTLLNGHGNHADDIIPPFGTFPGKHWDTAGRAIWDNDCIVPTIVTNPTTPTTPTTPTSVQQEAPVTSTAVADASGSIPSTGAEQNAMLVIGAAMALGGLVITRLARRPHRA